MTTRKDKTQNEVKVAKARLKKPLGTVREIAEMAGVSKSSVATIDKTLDNVGQMSISIDKIIKKDAEIVGLVLEETKRRLTTPEIRGNMSDSDLRQYGDTSAKRYSLFKGEVTDDEGGLKLQDSSLKTQTERLDSALGE